MWINIRGSYSPAVNLNIATKLPSDIYKVSVEDNDFVIKPFPINTDELYVFKDSGIDNILSEIEDFWNKAEIYEQNNIIHKRGILLYGHPGNGKSTLISLLLEQLKSKNGLIFLVNNIDDFNRLNILLPTVIRKIEPNRPIITVIEDVDKLINSIGNDADLLDFMDGKNSINHHLVILTTNDTSTLSSALLRPSRIDMKYYLDFPTKKVRQEFFEKKGLDKELAKQYATLTEHFSYADLKEVFIGTTILNKSIEEIIKQITQPHEVKNFLNMKKCKIGL